MVVRMAEKRKKLLTISDAISAQTGLGRIHRDLVSRLIEHLSDVFDVATMGYGGSGTTKINVPQFPMEGMIEGMGNWLLPTLPNVCEDFFGKEKGTILAIWDASRLTWLASPRGCSELFTKFPNLQEWAMSRPFELWGYLPIDSSGPNDRLAFPIMRTLLGFDRLLAYGPFGEAVIRRTIGDEEADKRHLTWQPHSIDLENFFERHRGMSRKVFLHHTGARQFFELIGKPGATTAPIEDDEVLIGCLCTNQHRKSWQTATETVAILSRTHRVRFWAHTDDLERYWSLPNLFVDYGILDKTVISLGYVPDEKLAVAYSACDLTLGPGDEGWGLPLGESLACGCPVIHGSYAGGADVVPKQMQVDPVAFRYEGSYASKRAVYNASDWAARAEEWIGKRASLDPQYGWVNSWPTWEAWFREAAK
jgi:glycosyltransferase involved in cell wall biosynthesis